MTLRHLSSERTQREKVREVVGGGERTVSGVIMTNEQEFIRVSQYWQFRRKGRLKYKLKP